VGILEVEGHVLVRVTETGDPPPGVRDHPRRKGLGIREAGNPGEHDGQGPTTAGQQESPPVHAAISAIATPTPTPSIDVCAGGRPTQLTFIYTGDLCTASSHSQGKAVCTDEATAASGPVEIKYTGKDAGTKITVSPGSGASTGEVINVGNTFVLTSSRGDKGLHSNSKFDILQGGNIIQQLEIHTSCSNPLFVGDQFGSLRVAGFVSTP
ncbi:MAG: hypothetical protein IIC23_08135, partial [Chloroflexi bacterium]|nr:hypothetical protein [Chloroflexota bacterium]